MNGRRGRKFVVMTGNDMDLYSMNARPNISTPIAVWVMAATDTFAETELNSPVSVEPNNPIHAPITAPVAMAPTAKEEMLDTHFPGLLLVRKI